MTEKNSLNSPSMFLYILWIRNFSRKITSAPRDDVDLSLYILECLSMHAFIIVEKNHSGFLYSLSLSFFSLFPHLIFTNFAIIKSILSPKHILPKRQQVGVVPRKHRNHIKRKNDQKMIFFPLNHFLHFNSLTPIT